VNLAGQRLALPPDLSWAAFWAAAAALAPGSELLVEGVEPEVIGDLAATNGIALHLLAPIAPSLEDAFFEVTRSSQEYRAGLPPRPGASLPPPAAPGGAS
jgi:hypothetical protein